MVCLGFEPRAPGWEAQTKPRSYGGCPIGFLNFVVSLWTYNYARVSFQ